MPKAADNRTLSARSNDALNKLAAELATNYLDTSISSEEHSTDRKRIFEEICTEEVLSRLSEKPSRNILVVGPEASLDAFGPDAFPMAKEAMLRLDNNLPKRPKWINDRIRAEKQRLKIAYEYQDAENDFETHLAILSSIYSPPMIAEELASMYGERYWPHLTFELIAHMLKHRFIDVVINFAFDELLDQAIDEELGPSEKHYVVSDGDCKNLGALMVGNRLKTPIHVKPHGTAGHRSSLKFTKEQHFALPEQMRMFMERIVGGYVSDHANSERYPTNIISVGFGMRSLDLNQILKSISGTHPVTIYHLNTQKWFDGDFPKLAERTGVIRHEFINFNEIGLHATLRELISRVSEMFKLPYRPRGIARHEIIHKLFFDEKRRRRIPYVSKGQKQLVADADYHRARLCTELIISLAKNNGRIDLNSLIDDRVGTYFGQFREVTAAFDDDPGAASLDKVLKLFDKAHFPLPLSGIEGNILSAGYPAGKESRRGEWLWDALASALMNIQNDEIQTHVRRLSEFPSDLREWLQSLVRSEARDISPRFGHRQLLLSRAPDPDEVLHTNLGLSLKMAEIARSDWDVLLVVSEFGNTFKKCIDYIDSERLARKRFCLILAQSEHEPVTKSHLQRLLPAAISPEQVEVNWLPYWLHNRHMILGLKAQRRHQEWSYTSAIRYDRRGLSNRINPIYIDKTNVLDLARLEDTFFGYVWQARDPSWVSRYPSQLVIENEVSTLRKGMLKEWWEKARAG